MTEYFTLDVRQFPGQDPAVVAAALRRAWNACAEVSCSKCGVAAWQYCRDRTKGTWRITRFHRPRQDAAKAPAILAPAGIRGLGWAKQQGTFTWDDRRMPAA